MAAVSPAPTGATALTPPSSSHGVDMCDVAGGPFENTISDKNGTHGLEQALKIPLGPNGNSVPSSHLKSSHTVDLSAARRMHSTDNLNSAKWGKQGDGNLGSSPALTIEPRSSQGSSSDWSLHSKPHATDERKRQIQQNVDLEYSEEDSKWIHRDKLAKIESQELEAAGFIVPKVRASSRQRRARGQHSIDSNHSRHQIDSINADQRDVEPPSSGWDLRTPQEIAEEEENAYFAAQSLKGGTRIPVARISPAPIPQDYLERGAPVTRRIDSSEGDKIAYPKTRSRSASASTKDLELSNTTSSRVLNAKRSVTDTSPKKTTPRKASTASKSSTSTGRLKTRSGPSKDFGHPATRSGEPIASSHPPEGDPPWVLECYKPDPRLPPDQQLLPTVAKRLRQEQWEREGKFGDAYDKDFRPMNDHELPQPQERESIIIQDDEEDLVPTADWPLKTSAAKSPKQNSYSTMPRIPDKLPVSPMTPIMSPKTPISPPAATQSQAVELATQAELEKDKQAGCGCCIVM